MKNIKLQLLLEFTSDYILHSTHDKPQSMNSNYANVSFMRWEKEN